MLTSNSSIIADQSTSPFFKMMRHFAYPSKPSGLQSDECKDQSTSSCLEAMRLSNVVFNMTSCTILLRTQIFQINKLKPVLDARQSVVPAAPVHRSGFDKFISLLILLTRNKSRMKRKDNLFVMKFRLLLECEHKPINDFGWSSGLYPT